jgi:DnaK suppressor protein
MTTRPMELLRTMLEEQYTADTDRLTRLTLSAALPRHGGQDPRALDVQAACVRRRIAETAQALRRMSEGSYGQCAYCEQPIPLGRLRATPHAAFCAFCQRRPVSARAGTGNGHYARACAD